jgi:hypothetical protein
MPANLIVLLIFTIGQAIEQEAVEIRQVSPESVSVERAIAAKQPK